MLRRQKHVLSQDPLCVHPTLAEKVFVSQERVSGFPEKGAALRGSPGTSGEVWETSREALDCPEGPRIEKFQDFAPGLKISSDQSQIEIFNRD